jgi:anthranilate/para-aminobenzoate synthase component I
MQIIDELEVAKRGPYGGGVGHVSFTGAMDMALGLRTMVVPTNRDDTMYRCALPAAFGVGSGGRDAGRNECIPLCQPHAPAALCGCG